MATSIRINPRLLVNVQDEPGPMLKPISQYAKERLVTLKEVCEPLKVIIEEELEQNIQIAEWNSQTPKDGLTQDESAAIHLYTMEWEETEKSLYVLLNRTLREADRNRLIPWHKYLKLILTAFFKLPSTERRTVWRGVPKNLSHLYPEGQELVWWGFSSCTSSIKVLESPSYLGKSGARTLFSIETSKGKHIRFHSYFKQEDEILLPPGIYLRVVSQLNPAQGLYIIHLEEIPPPMLILTPPFDVSKQPVKSTPVYAAPKPNMPQLMAQLEKTQITPTHTPKGAPKYVESEAAPPKASSHAPPRYANSFATQAWMMVKMQKFVLN